MTPSPTSDLEKLKQLANYNETRTVVVNGETHTVTVKQIKTGKIPKLLAAARGMIYTLTETKNLDVQNLVLTFPEEALDVLAVLIEKDRAFVDDLDLDDAVDLLTLCLEVNVDFFVQRVLPWLFAALQRASSALKAKNIDLGKLAGQTLPSTSSQPGTGSPTSGSTPTASSAST